MTKRMLRAAFAAGLLAAGAAAAQPRTGQAGPSQEAAGSEAQPLSEGARALSDNARDVLARARPSVVQIKGFFGTNTARAFHGTGFAVAPGGVLLTNYHVVAQKVLYPDKYRLEFNTPEGATGKIYVLAVDVRHDLAVVRAEGYAPPPLAFEESVPAKGERAYSIGFPLDVGLTITEGVSNGRVADSFDPRIHYSGAINAGMSGGPTLNANGRVIGINVSGYRFEQLVSFLVPALHARALIERGLQRSPGNDEVRREVAAQLRAHADALLGAFGGVIKTQRAAGFSLPARLTPFMDCGAAGDPSPEQQVQTERISCSAKAGLYVQDGMYTGDIRYSHYVLTTTRLGAWRFAHRLSNLTQASGGFGSRKFVGPFACRDSAVRLDGFDASVLVCTRGYRKFAGLYDFTVRVVSLNQPDKAVASHLDMYGVGFDAGMQFVRRYVEAMRWNP